MVNPADMLNAAKAYSQRRDLQRRRLDLLNDNCKAHVEQEISVRFKRSERNRENARVFMDLGNNLYRAVIEKVATVYKEPPRRKFKLGRDTALWNRVVDPMLDLTMETVNRVTLACNECFVRPVVREGSIEFDVITPDLVEVAADGIHAKQLIYATDDGYVYLDDFFEIFWDKTSLTPQVAPHYVGVLPAALFRWRRPYSGFWLGTLGEDLVAAYFCEVLRATWTNMLAFFGGHKELARKPLPESTPSRGEVVQQEAGPHVIHDGDLSVLDMKTDLEQFVALSNAKVQRVAANWGVNADVLNQGNFGSGLARLLAHSGLNEVRMATIKLFRPAEQSLMSIAAAVWNASLLFAVGAPAETDVFNPPERLEPTINYGEPQLVESKKDRTEVLGLRMELGLESVVDAVMAEDPDLKDRTEALEKIQRNLEENGIVLEARRRYSVPDAITAALGAVGGRASGETRRPPMESEVDQTTETEE